MDESEQPTTSAGGPVVGHDRVEDGRLVLRTRRPRLPLPLHHGLRLGGHLPRALLRHLLEHVLAVAHDRVVVLARVHLRRSEMDCYYFICAIITTNLFGSVAWRVWE